MATGIPDNLDRDASAEGASATAGGPGSGGEHRLIPAGLIDEPADPHRVGIDTDELSSLIESIRQEGILQPLVLRPSGSRFEVIAGHRRLLAARYLGLDEIPCIVHPELDDAGAHRARAAENLIRVQLSPMEEAIMVDALRASTNMAVDQLARHLSRSNYWVETRLRLANLPEDLATLVHSGDLSHGHAIALSRVDDPVYRSELTSHAARGGATLPIVQGWVQAWIYSREAGHAPPEINYTQTTQSGSVVVVCECPGCQERVAYTQTTLVRMCLGCAAVILEPNP